MDQTSSVEALPEQFGDPQCMEVTQATLLAHALEEILMVRSGMGEGICAGSGNQPRRDPSS